MTNAVYQATVEALEALMSPRIVSRSLQEGLKDVGKSPTELAYGDVEKILKTQVYRQLQVTMPVTEAKAKIGVILDRLKTLQPERDPALGRTLGQQQESLEELRESLRPFNLFFEWPEVQKLRAQLQLIEKEHAAGRLVSRALHDAHAQLALVGQKLEDQLVLQAKALAELQEALAVVASLGGPRVRRLENLLGHIGEAQLTRQLAPAELEHARKLATDLRKLMESSVVLGNEPAQPSADAVDLTLTPVPTDDELLSQETTPAEAEVGVSISPDSSPDSSPDVSPDVSPEVSAKLRRLDLESQQQDLDGLEQSYAHLLAFEPDLQDAFQATATRLGEEGAAAALASLREQLAAREAACRSLLKQELEQLLTALAALPDEVDSAETSYLLHVTLSVLDATLPPLRDVQRLRDLAQLAQDQGHDILRREAEARAAQVSKRAQQTQARERLEATLSRHRGAAGLDEEVTRLERALYQLRRAEAQDTVDGEALAEARQAEIALEGAAASYTQAESERQRAQLHGLLSDLRSLPLEPLDRQGLEQRLEAHLGMVGHDSLSGGTISALHEELQVVKQDLRGRYRDKLGVLRERAEGLGVKPLLTRLAADEAGLEADSYPELGEIERALSSAAEARRAEQLHDLHRLEGELSSQAGEAAQALQMKLDAARAQLQANRGPAPLEALWAELDALRGKLAERSADFLPRLDQALAAFARVQVINSDEVAQAGRILRHLDAQRIAFERVSSAMRSELEASLQKAEHLIADLQDQLEATQAVAGQLAGGDFLDGLFGAFGAFDFGAQDNDTDDGASQVSALNDSMGGRTPNDSAMDDSAMDDSAMDDSAMDDSVMQVSGTSAFRSGRPEVDGWVDGLLARPGVAGALLFAQGQPLSGNLPQATDLPISAFDGGVQALGRALGLGAPRVSVLETPNGALVTLFCGGHRLLLSLNDPELVGDLLEALEAERAALGELLAAAP